MQSVQALLTDKSRKARAESLFHENVKLASYLANKWRVSFPPFYHEDVYSEARLGLWKACLTFDEAKGARFSTYAGSVITRQLAMFYRDYVQRRQGSEEVSLDQPVTTILQRKGAPELFIGDSLADDVDLEELVIHSELKKQLKQLDPVAYDYYINDKKQMALSKEYGLSQAQISRKIRSSITKLREKYA